MTHPRRQKVSGTAPVAPTAALPQWENEGGRVRERADADAAATDSMDPAQLHMRVIALENLLIAMLAGASVHQRAVAEAMGRFISPRPGHTPHPLTLRAAQAMDSLLGRAERFRADAAPDEAPAAGAEPTLTSSPRP